MQSGDADRYARSERAGDDVPRKATEITESGGDARHVLLTRHADQLHAASEPGQCARRDDRASAQFPFVLLGEDFFARRWPQGEPAEHVVLVNLTDHGDVVGWRGSHAG